MHLHLTLCMQELECSSNVLLFSFLLYSQRCRKPLAREQSRWRIGTLHAQGCRTA